MTKPYITVNNAVKVSDLSRSSIYREMADGRLKSKKVRGRRLVDFDSLMSLGREA